MSFIISEEVSFQRYEHMKLVLLNESIPASVAYTDWQQLSIVSGITVHLRTLETPRTDPGAFCIATELGSVPTLHIPDF